MNIIMKHINKIFLGALASLTMFACSDDFLETSPTSSVATGVTFSTTENVKLAVNGLAYLLTTQHSAYSQGCCGENYVRSIYQEYPSQEYRYNRMSAGWADVMNGGSYFSVSTSRYSRYAWNMYYEIISGANSIICNVDGASGSDAEKKFYKAQALAFRAYCYEKLLQYYSVRWKDSDNGAADGVVMRIDESTGDQAVSSMKACYDQIYADLDQAIQCFTESGLDRAATDVWLPNLATAYAVYARAALAREDYAKALDMATKARAGFPLMSNADYLSGFCNPTSEWIFGCYAGTDENNWYWTFGTQFACNGYYSQKYYYVPCIEKELTDRMPTADIRMSQFITVDKFSTPYVPDGSQVEQTYGDIKDPTWNAEAVAYVAAYQSTNVPSLAATLPAYTYVDGGMPVISLGAQLKFWVFDLPGVSYICNIRSSEMVLIQAEASYFLGEETDAQNYLIELNATSGRNSAYTCSKTGTALFDEIRDYRELELWGEGFNWFDMKRWKLDIVRKSFAEGGNSHAATATTVGATSYDWKWAIPDIEYEYNGAIK